MLEHGNEISHDQFGNKTARCRARRNTTGAKGMRGGRESGIAGNVIEGVCVGSIRLSLLQADVSMKM